MSGELAERLAPVLLGMGITSLSMSAAAVPAVRASMARHTREECAKLARIALDAPDAVSARAAVAERVGQSSSR